MSRKVASKDDFQTHMTWVSEWQTATRNDALVAGESNATRSMDRVYALNTASFFDELFHYIREIGAWPLLVGLDPQDRKGALYPFVQFVLVTIMRCVGGLQSALATQEVLLTDEALIALIGLNAAQAQQGSTTAVFPVARPLKSVRVVVRDDCGQHREVLYTDPPDDAFAGFDACDDRSLVENICNREAKESWFIEHLKVEKV